INSKISLRWFEEIGVFAMICNARDTPRYYLHAPIIGALASQARHDSRPQSLMIRGVLSPGLVGGW
ncbi:hypothetical protein ACGYTZ_31820, partial [Burkholderia pseudomallei]